LFVLVYGIVFAMGIYYINRLIAKGPEGRAAEAPEHRILSQFLRQRSE
jgi:cytochrome bd ubiquinol oxidase subunit I